MVAAMGMVMMMMAVGVVMTHDRGMVMVMIVIVMMAPGVSMHFGNVRHRRAAPVAPELQKLRRQQIEADYSDHRIAHAFELVGQDMI